MRIPSDEVNAQIAADGEVRGERESLLTIDIVDRKEGGSVMHLLFRKT